MQTRFGAFKARERAWRFDQMPFVVNSAPGAGLRFEPSATLPNARAALSWAAGLERRGMRMIRIRDTESGKVFDERMLRDLIAQA
jgi:hypothetical protein